MKTFENEFDVFDDLTTRLLNNLNLPNEEQNQDRIKELVDSMCGQAFFIESIIEFVEKEIEKLKATKDSLNASIETNMNKLFEKIIQINILYGKINKIALRESTRVEILNEEDIPEEYKEKIVTYKIDKKRISDDIKIGKIVSGASLQTFGNIHYKKKSLAELKKGV